MSLLDQDNESTDGPSKGAAGVVVGVIVALALVVLGVVGFAIANSSGKASAQTRTITIPAGTGARIDAGEKVDIIPAQYPLNAGDTVVIVNNDDRLQDVGPFKVRPGETIRYRFDTPGKYSGVCTIHPSGEVAFVVT